LSVEHLISLALACDKPITIDLNGYEENSHLLTQIKNRIEEANFVLSSFCDKELRTNLYESPHQSVKKEDPIKKEVSVEQEENLSSRRDFLSQASVEGVVKHKKTFDDAVEAEDLQVFKIDADVISKMRDKNIPDKRKILFTTLKRANVPDLFEVLPEEEVSFVSQKYIDDSCTNCQICYRVCPAGALSSNGKFSLINFDAMLCLKCHLCHDVCDSDSIHLQKGFEIKEFFEPSQRTLVSFDIKRCDECGGYFTYQGGERVCPRCRVEEDEAIALHQNAKMGVRL